MKRHPAGYFLALLASGMLLAASFLALGTVLYIAFASWHQNVMPVLRELLSSTPLPLFVYLIWALSVFGSGAAIVAVALYNFRERWFWRCLLVASVLWLFLPPLHTVIGLISLILLLNLRHAFLSPAGGRPA